MNTEIDPVSSGDLTRAVTGAPVSVNSDFIAVTQNAGGGTPDGDDIVLRTFSSVTNIRTINRFGADQDGSGPLGGPQRAGGVQWTIDLSPLNSYLSSNSLSLTALDLDMVTTVSANMNEYDMYLSYTNPAESITLAGLATGATAGDDNYDNFWFPAQGVAEGAIANGTHKVIELDETGNLSRTVDLLGLYNAGVTDLNLILASGAFNDERQISIAAGSGLSIDTAPAVPEPSSSLLAALAMGAALVKRRR